MHDYTNETHVKLSASKENLVRMLNNAIHNVGSDIVISIDEPLLMKLKEADNSCCFLLPEFLDEESIKECGWAETVHGYRNEYKDECYDYVKVIDIKVTEDVYVVELYSRVHEEVEIFGDSSWKEWGKVAAHLYQCHIIIDRVNYCDGAFNSLDTYIFEESGSEVKMEQLSPRIDCQQLHETYDELMELDYTKYLQYKIEDFESMIESMKNYVDEMKADLEDARNNPRPVVKEKSKEKTVSPSISIDDLDLPFPNI